MNGHLLIFRIISHLLLLRTLLALRAATRLLKSLKEGGIHNETRRTTRRISFDGQVPRAVRQHYVLHLQVLRGVKWNAVAIKVA